MKEMKEIPQKVAPEFIAWGRLVADALAREDLVLAALAGGGKA
jgi:hypothetical protein